MYIEFRIDLYGVLILLVLIYLCYILSNFLINIFFELFYFVNVLFFFNDLYFLWFLMLDKGIILIFSF